MDTKTGVASLSEVYYQGLEVFCWTLEFIRIVGIYVRMVFNGVRVVASLILVFLVIGLRPPDKTWMELMEMAQKSHEREDQCRDDEGMDTVERLKQFEHFWNWS
jgi:hypothetical protein